MQKKLPLPVYMYSAMPLAFVTKCTRHYTPHSTQHARRLQAPTPNGRAVFRQSCRHFSDLCPELILGMPPGNATLSKKPSETIATDPKQVNEYSVAHHTHKYCRLLDPKRCLKISSSARILGSSPSESKESHCQTSN